ARVRARWRRGATAGGPLPSPQRWAGRRGRRLRSDAAHRQASQCPAATQGTRLHRRSHGCRPHGRGMTVSVRPLSADEARLLTAARLVATEHAPYLAHALFASRPVAAEGLGTFAVDRGWRLYVDPSTLAGSGPALAGGVLVHEVSHL